MISINRTLHGAETYLARQKQRLQNSRSFQTTVLALKQGLRGADQELVRQASTSRDFKKISGIAHGRFSSQRLNVALKGFAIAGLAGAVVGLVLGENKIVKQLFSNENSRMRPTLFALSLVRRSPLRVAAAIASIYSDRDLRQQSFQSSLKALLQQMPVASQRAASSLVKISV